MIFRMRFRCMDCHGMTDVYRPLLFLFTLFFTIDCPLQSTIPLYHPRIMPASGLQVRVVDFECELSDGTPSSYECPISCRTFVSCNNLNFVALGRRLHNRLWLQFFFHPFFSRGTKCMKCLHTHSHCVYGGVYTESSFHYGVKEKLNRSFSWHLSFCDLM